MSECLVTKLKGTVDDSSLLKLNEMLFTVSYDSSCSDGDIAHRITLKMATTDGTIRTLDGSASISVDNGSTWVSSATIGSASSTMVYFKNADFDVAVSDKYDFAYIGISLSSENSVYTAQCIAYDFNNVAYMDKLQSIVISSPDITGDLLNLHMGNAIMLGLIGGNFDDTVDINDFLENITFSSNSSTTYFSIVKPNILTGTLASTKTFDKIYQFSIRTQSDLVINLSVVADILPSSLTYLYLQSMTQCTGDISTLGTFTSLTGLRLTGTSVSGTVEGFVNAQRVAGRSSCDSMNVQLPSTVTFNEEAVSIVSDVVLSWTETQITFNSVTITA